MFCRLFFGSMFKKCLFILHCKLLWLSSKEECITQIMLARHTKLDVMMTSQVLRALESRGLILRLAHPIDTRAKMLKLTQAGRKLAIGEVPDVENVDNTFFGVLGKKRKSFNSELHCLISKD